MSIGAMSVNIDDSDGHTSAETPLDVFRSIFNRTHFSMESLPFPPGQGIVSYRLLYVFTIVNYVVLSVTVSLCGLVANTINIVVFLRLGFKETINISLFGMAVSDLVLQTMTLWVAVCLNPWFETINITAGEPISYVGAWVQVTCTRITGWITAFVTFERCVCIILPLKVKEILSPTRVKLVIGVIFAGATICILPVYLTFRIDKVIQPRRNESSLALVFVESMADVQDAMFYLNNVASPLGSFTVVVICTSLLVVNINRTARWRVKLTANKGDTTTKARDRKLIKMVASIAAIYIVCYTPTISIFIWMVEDVEFSFSGRYRNLFMLLTSFAFLLESVNSSLNIFIYYVMSSKYREAFNLHFCKKEASVS